MVEFDDIVRQGVSGSLISAEDIAECIKRLQVELERDYRGRRPVLIGILRGCFLFFADLVRNLKVDCTMDFMRVSSYAGKASSREIILHADISVDIEGKDVLIVEDIVDTGLTSAYLMDRLALRRPQSIEICTLLDKPSKRETPVTPKYVGFTIGNKFVVGYGLDLDQRFRHLPFIGVSAD